MEKYSDPYRVEDSEQNRTHGDPLEFVIACKSPDAAVKAEDPKDGDRNDRVDRGEFEPCRKIFAWDLRILAVKPKP